MEIFSAVEEKILWINYVHLQVRRTELLREYIRGIFHHKYQKVYVESEFLILVYELSEL